MKHAKITITVVYDMDGSPSPDLTGEQIIASLKDSVDGAIGRGLLDIGPVIEECSVEVEA